MVLLLVDGEIGPTKSDLQMLDWLRANELPHSVIATKHDKVKATQAGQAQARARRGLHARHRATSSG